MKLRDSLAAALFAVCLAAPAYAQSNNGGTNNSNFSGTNNSNATGLNFCPPASSSSASNSCTPGPGKAGYSAATLSQASSLQQQLAAAQSALDNYKPASTGIRSFTRSAPSGSGSGNSGGQERAQLEANLLKAQNDAAAFLESVKNPKPDQLGSAQGSGAKVGPTW
jgi:hypothetical protein